MKARYAVLVSALLLLGSVASSQVRYFAGPGENLLRVQLINLTEQDLRGVNLRFASNYPQWLLPKTELTFSVTGYRLGRDASRSIVLFDFPFDVSTSGLNDSEVSLELVQSGQVLGAFKVFFTSSAPDGGSAASGTAVEPVPHSQLNAEEKSGVVVPTEYALEQNYPNPFNPATNIQFRLSEKGWTVLRVYDLLGREIRTLVRGEMPAASHRVSWDGRDGQGGLVPTGVYIYRLTTSHFVSTKKMIIVR